VAIADNHDFTKARIQIHKSHLSQSVPTGQSQQQPQAQGWDSGNIHQTNKDSHKQQQSNLSHNEFLARKTKDDP
jgi:hypothetical protein